MIMTDEQINIAIAEACGWKKLSEYNGAWGRDLQRTYLLPDYCNDLNAMHEAEKVFGEVYSIKSCEYDDWLQSIIEHDQKWRATARQRAEAFLKNINKWEEWSDD
jgi:hypothetical protein